MFWDSSALVPLLLPEARSDELSALLGSDREPALWWGSPIECQSAIYRRHQQVAIPPQLLRTALQRLRVLVDDLDGVAPTDEVRERAGRLLAAHPLRAADALQLAAAVIWSDERPTGETFVCLDERLREAARREDFLLFPQSPRIF